MPTQTQSNYSKRHDVYTEVTAYVVASLEKGDIIWSKPWNSYGLPKNVTGCKPYRGWNAFLLNFICLIKNYSIPYFITYLQAQQLGGNVKKGERGCQIKRSPVKKDSFAPYIYSSEEMQHIFEAADHLELYDKHARTMLVSVPLLIRMLMPPALE